MAGGTLQRDPSSGKFKRDPDNGLLKRNSDTDSTCCCGCQYCDGSSPATFQLTFADVDIRGCQNAADPTVFDEDRCRFWYSMAITDGVLDGTYCLKKSDTDPCLYCADIDTITLEIYSEADCGGDVLIVEADVYIELRVTGSGYTVNVYFRMEHASGYFHPGFFLGILKGWLFSGSYVGGTPCSTSHTVTSDFDNTTPFGDQLDNILADSGTCLVEPDECAVEDALECGSLETQCPTDCSGCCNSLVAVVTASGLDVNCSGAGTYTLTRSGCVWSDANGSECFCDAGVWTLVLNAGPPKAFPLVFAAEDTGSGCPPESGWDACDQGGHCFPSPPAAVSVTC